jgi:hypothetical protein
MLPQIAGVALAAVVLKLRASRPRYPRHRGAYSVPESAAPGAGGIIMKQRRCCLVFCAQRPDR